ncbi:hypothetical protein VKT23_009131 [Stygiomarasmius scandens]|uniref:Uncharacterized protein n=1 Tax=Marasmiellus scandens TaxID=2682957 RepID=A0ABR1JJR1_9AGAR
MELGLQNAHYSTLTLRVPTLRLLRTHHPYKRVLYIDNLPLQAHVDLFGEDLDRFLAAVRSMASTPTRTAVATSQTTKPRTRSQGQEQGW